MNLTKKVTAWFLMLVMVLGLIPQTVFAQETVASVLSYEVKQQINEDKTESTISLKFIDTETTQLEKVILPDGTEKAEDLSTNTYTVSENGTYDFKVNYLKDGASLEEIISVEVSGVEKKSTEENQVKEKEKTASVKKNSNLLKASGNNYEVSTADELKNALEQIKSSKDKEATILLKNDISNGVSFVGVADKSITVKSIEGKKFKIALGSVLAGDITLDNVSISAGTLYCNGHRTIFTENSVFSMGSLYGGAYEKDVDSVYVKINGKGTINSGSSELVIVGGCYKGSVNGSVYMEVDGDIKINSTQGGHYITGGSKETRYGGDTYTGEPLYVNGDIDFILGLNDASVGHNVSGTHNTHVYGDLNMNIKSGKYIGIDGQREEPKKATVDGNINMVIGEPASTKPVHVTYNWGIVGAGERIANSRDLYKVGKDVNITTYDNVWCWEPGEKPGNDIGGLTGAESATVGGDVNITVNDSHLKDIVGVDNGLYYNNPTINGNVNIIANDAHLESKFTECFIYPATDDTFIKGNANVLMNGGRTNQISAYNGTIDGKVSINLTGKPTITHDVIGKYIKNTSPSDESILNVDKGTVTIPNGIWYFKTVNIDNKSDVALGNSETNAFQSGIYDVNVTDSSLTTNKQAYSKGSLTVNDGSFTANGNTYISEITNTKNSTIHFKSYVDLGYKYKNEDTWNKEVLKSENDTYTFGPNNSLNKVHGHASFVNGKCNIYGWLKIFGDYNGKSNDLDIYAFTGDYNYPDVNIKLEILGKAAGTTDVTLVDSADVTKEGTPVVGQNYINALTESDKTFVLANNNARENGLYFKKLKDADSKNKADYDMWQVAKKAVYPASYEFVSGTKDKELPKKVLDLLPEDATKYLAGDIITAILPNTTEITVTDGVWVFKGYDADSKVSCIENINETGCVQFIGTWEFKEKDTDTDMDNVPVSSDDPNKPNNPNNPNNPSEPNEPSKTHKLVNENKPSKETKANDKSPKTGDEANIAWWLLLTASGAGVTILYRKKRKTN